MTVPGHGRIALVSSSPTSCPLVGERGGEGSGKTPLRSRPPRPIPLPSGRSRAAGRLLLRRGRFVLGAMVLLASPLLAGEHLAHLHGGGTPPPGKPRCLPHTHERAGYPQCLARHAEQTRTAGGIGYYVGGGAAHHGEPRCREEGTWGWDETGHPCFRRRVVLGWWHGRKFQGGPGRYATDGPHVPDVIAGTTAAVENHHAGK